MKKLMSSIALTTVLLSTTGLAHSHGVECIQDNWIRLDLTPKNSLGTCKVQDVLERAVGNRSYPLLTNNPYQVEYWHGSYQRPVVSTYNYQHEVYNLCTGKTLISEIKPQQNIEMMLFSVDNPNLNESVVANWQLLPMTEEEAKTSFAKAKSDCEKYQLETEK